MVLGTLDIQHAENRRIQIVRLNANVAAGAGYGNARPDDHGRNANAALVNAALAAAQRVIAGDGRDVFLAGGIRLLEPAVDIPAVVE